MSNLSEPNKPASALLIKNARAVFQHGKTYPSPCDIRIKDGLIADIGQNLIPQDEDIIDASKCVVYPGLVNTHHHIAQSVLKGIPAGLNQGLGDWLASVPYRYWPHIDPELMYAAARLGLYELLRSGATTCADHHYLYHANSSQELEDAVWQAADDLGMRLILCRGSATATGSHRGMASNNIQPESLDQVLNRMEHSRARYHQSGSNAMRQLVVAPTSLIHSTTPEHLRELGHYARSHQLKRHSHLLEVAFDESRAQALHGKSAVEYAADCGWLESDVWFAHLVQADEKAIQMLAQAGTGISHCPTSNCRLGSGIAAVVPMAKANMPISIGVDGSASAESASMIQELNLTWLIHRAVHGPEATQAEDVIDWGSRGGAHLLGLTDVGELLPGKAADLVLYDISHPRYSGVHSPLLAPLICGEPVKVRTSIINGRVVLGANTSIDEEALTQAVTAGLMRLHVRVMQ
jgi:cytosine/adenosine deaminase-related metal-dependent hydrolase|tara:strand:+ start:4574 stop:5965 length:1392 start_codon:yes stop_codon:yes gene_type:complete